jgi:general secretion pathway protein N
MARNSRFLMPTLQRPALAVPPARAPWRWAMAGLLLGTLLSLVVCAPARWLAWGVAQATGARVQLLQAQGTVWSGSAQLVLGAGAGSQEATALPGRLLWQLRPSSQGMALALQAPCCLPQPWVWQVQPFTSTGLRLQLADMSAAQAAQWPASILAGLGTPWNTLQLQGTLALSSQQLVLDIDTTGWHMQGSAQVDALALSTSLSTLRPVGSYRVRLQGGPAPTIDISTLDGSLQLRGQGQWVQGRLQFNGEASATPERAEALGNLLNIIGRREGARSLIKVG